MTRIRSLLVCILTLGALTASVASAQACDTWKSAVSGSWGTPSDWSSGEVPGNTEEACITLPGNYTVTLEPYMPVGGEGRTVGGGTVKSLTIGSPNGTGTQTLDLAGQSFTYGGEQQNGVSLGVSPGTATINATGALILDSTALNTQGFNPLDGNEPGGNATFAGTLLNYGHLESQVQDSHFENILESSVTNEPGGSIQVASGTLNVDDNTSTTNKGLVTVDPAGVYKLNGGSLFTNDGSVVNEGSTSLTRGGAGPTVWTQSGGSVSGHAVAIQEGATLADSVGAGQFLMNVYEANLTGTIPAGQTVTMQGGETYGGTGLSLENEELVNDGTLVIDSSGSGEAGGHAPVINYGSIQNNGKILAQMEDPSSWPIQDYVVLNNGPSGTFEVQGGRLQQYGATPTTNEGLVTVGPAGVYILEGSPFVNESDGTVSPQIAGASSFGSFVLDDGEFAAAGTLAPVLVGGFVPAAGQEFETFSLAGGHLTGAFAAVANGFSADYSHSYETAGPYYVGVIYGAATGGTGGGSTGSTGGSSTGSTDSSTGSTGASTGSVSPPVVHVGAISGAHGNLAVTLSCPAGGASCQAATVQATVTEHLKGGKVTVVTARNKNKKKPAVKTKTVVIASGGTSLAAGATKTLTLTLNAAGRALLQKYGKLTAIVTVRSAGKTIGTVTVHVQKAASARR